MATTAAWLARTQKRRNGELGMLRRPSEISTVTSSTYSNNRTEASPTSPTSPHSSVSTTNSSIAESFEQVQALQNQLQKNNAQIEANEKRMHEISRLADEREAIISRRLAEVSQLNKQLDSLSVLFSRFEKAAQGNLHAGLSE